MNRPLDPLVVATFTLASCSTDVYFDVPVAVEIVGASPVVMTEGQSEMVSVRLTRRPTRTVRLTLTSSDPGELQLAADELSISPSDWQESRQFRVDVSNDVVAEGTERFIITIDSSSSPDPDYADLLPLELGVFVPDDEEPAIVLSNVSGATLVETLGSPFNLSFSVRLDRAIDEAIHLPVALPTWIEPYVEANMTDVVFTPENWNVPQTVSLRAWDDGVALTAASFDVVIGNQLLTFAYVDND